MSWKKVSGNETNSKWQGKTWVVLGDSNSTSSYAIPYHQLLQFSKGINVLNYAKGGAGWIAQGGSGQAPRVVEQLAEASASADLITIMSGGNDYSLDYPLGQLGDATLDTFYGALDLTIKATIDKYPLKTIAVFTQMRRRSEQVRPNGTSVPLQVKATIDVCKKYSIPVLDLYNHGNMYPWNDTWFTACMMDDGVHLISKGHEILANKVKNFIDSI